MTKLVGATTMMIRDGVEIESGHWFMILVHGSQNHSEMTEKAGSGNGTEVEACGGHLSLRKEALVGEQGCGGSEQEGRITS